MKRCPQCNTVFENEMIYCKEDGTTLINEPLPLPSDFTPDENNNDEERTVIRNESFTVDIPPPQMSDRQSPPPMNRTQSPVNPYPPQMSPPETNRGCYKYSIFLLIGLILGGGIALGIVGFGYYYMQNSTAENQNSSIEKTAENNSVGNSDATPDDKHSEKNADAAAAGNLNGRIIKNNAILRASPSSSASRIDTLPFDDRIEIIDRKSLSSKWYEIECEHGSRGWIDGYSIEFAE